VFSSVRQLVKSCAITDSFGSNDLDDWLIVLAEVSQIPEAVVFACGPVLQPLSLIGVSLAIAAAAHGWGKPAAYFSPADLQETLRLQSALQTVWLFSFYLVRFSVACSSLRYRIEKTWRWPLCRMISMQILICSSYVVIQFAQCKPISSNWETVPGAVCWAVDPVIKYGWTVAGMLAVNPVEG
jgi:hypothetical protein